MVHAIVLGLDIVILLITIGIILYIFKALIITKNRLFTANLYFLIAFIVLFSIHFINILVSLDIITNNSIFELVRNIFRLIFLILLLVGSYEYSKLLHDSADKLTKDRINKKTK